MSEPITVPDWVDRNEYPWTPKTFETPNGKISYLDEGKGRPIVMFHGNPTWSFVYRHVIKELVGEFRCIVPDYLGFGLSDKPTDFSYEPAAHLEALEPLFESLDIHNAVVVVQDWGGPIGLGWAGEHRHRVSNLVIMNTWAWPVNDDKHFVKFSKTMSSFPIQFLIKRFNFFVNVVMKKAYGNVDKLTPEIHAHYQNPVPNAASRSGIAQFPKEILNSHGYLEMVERRIKRIAEKRTLIIWGKKDMAFRAKELERFRKLFPRNRVIEFDTVGHWPQEEQGREVGRLIRRMLEAEAEEASREKKRIF